MRLTKLALFFSTILALVLGLIFLINYEKKQNKIKELHTKQAQMLKLAKENLQKGDLIFRVGLDSDSAIISLFDKNGWSHVGFALSSEQIIHSAPKDDFGSGISVISTQDFIKGAKKIGIARYDLNSEQIEKIIQNLRSKLGQEFILSTDEENAQNYCTSFLQVGFASAGLELKLPKKQINLPFIKGAFIMPSAFWSDKNAKIILEFQN